MSGTLTLLWARLVVRVDVAHVLVAHVLVVVCIVWCGMCVVAPSCVPLPFFAIDAACVLARPCSSRTVARTGVLTPDIGAQDAMAESIRDSVKERLASRSRRRTGGGNGSPPGAAARTREISRMMRGEQAMTPHFGAALTREEGRVATSSSSRQRRRRGAGRGRRAGRPNSVVSRASSRSAASRSRRRGHGSPGSVASGRSGRSAFSTGTSLSRARAIDVETRNLLKSLSQTNEAMTRALTRA